MIRVRPVQGDPFAQADDPRPTVRRVDFDPFSIPAAKRAPDPRAEGMIADAGKNDGFFDRVGSYWNRANSALDAGAYRLSSAVNEWEVNNPLPWRRSADIARISAHVADQKAKAAELERVAAAPIAGSAGIGDLASNFSMSNLGEVMASLAVESAPAMAELASNPMGVVSSFFSRTGSVAQQRAENSGRTDANAGDAGVASLFAAPSTALDLTGLGMILKPGAKTVGGRIAQAAFAEGATEGSQGALEYAGGTLGTDEPFSFTELGKQAAVNAAGGTLLGGALRTAGEGPHIARKTVNAAKDVREKFLVRPVEGDPFAESDPPRDATEPLPGRPSTEPQPAAPTSPPEASASPASPPVDEPQPVAGGGDRLRPDPGELGEGESYLTTPAGGRVRARFEVVDASRLKAAEGELQNRDRSRDSTELQVQDISKNLDPTRLGASSETDRGAPIVGPDDVIESGNGRFMALSRVYDDPDLRDRAQAYRDFITSQGYSVEGIERPVLIRRRTNDFTPEQRRQFVIDSNQDAKLALTSVERARSDADALDGESLSLFRGGDVSNAGNADFVKAFIGRMSPSERAMMLDGENQLSQDGIVRIENALMARAYEQSEILSKLMEARDNNIRSIGAGMLDNAAPWAKLRAAAKEGDVKSEFDVTSQLVEAARRVSDLRARGEKIGDVLAQNDAFNKMDPLVERFMRLFYNPELTRAASREAISDAIGKYVRRASEQTTAPRMFGGEDMTPDQILDGIMEERGDGTGQLFPVAAEDRIEANEDLDSWHEEVRARRRKKLDRGEEEITETPRKTAEKTESDTGRETPSEPDDAISGGQLNEEPQYDSGRQLNVAGSYQPSFLQASFTNRTSLFNSAAETLGIDPAKFRLMDAPRQVTLLGDLLKSWFGVTVTVDRGMQERFAIDQMLDAFQNVQAMAYILGLPQKAIGLDNALSLHFQKKASYLGAYYPGEKKIILPKRSNSFAHEWAHAVDWYLLDKLTDADGRGLTGAVRRDGSGMITEPQNVREAFVDLLNTMFFDKAEAAAKIMKLEQQIAASKSEKRKAELQAQLARLKDGSSQSRTARSDYYKNAKSFDGPAGDYWQSPTEMFARAFEAYVSYKVEAEGMTTEFIGKGDANYLSNAEERFAKTFPKDQERVDIFAAFEHLFGNLAQEKAFGDGQVATPPAGSVSRMTDYDKTPAQRREGNVIQRELAAIRKSVLQARKAAAERANDPKGLVEKIADLNGATFMSMAANLRMIHARSKSPALQELIDLLTKQDGRGDRTVVRTFDEDVKLQSRQAINRLTNILKANNIEVLEGDTAQHLRDLLIGDREDGPPNLVKAAGAIRHLLDHEFYVNQQAGIDLGYTRNGYLQRVLDMPKVYNDQPGFVRDATKVYEIVFDNEFNDPGAVLSDDKLLARFMRMARRLAKSYPIDALPEVRQLLKKLRKLMAQAAKSEDPDQIQAKVDELNAELEAIFGELFDQVRDAFADDRARAWLAKINLVAGQEYNAASPDSKYTKHRELPPETDKIMEKYFLSDPVESVTNYLVSSARRTAYARRFGPNGEKRIALFERMASEGVSAADQISVARILDTATGRVRSQLPASVQHAAAFINFMGTMKLLPRAVISSLHEPITASLVTGNPLDGIKLLGMQISGALGSANGKARYELGRAIGIISDAASTEILEARYGQTYADATRWDRYVAKMFQRTGLVALTRAQKTASIGLGHAYLDNLSWQIVGHGGNGKPEARNNAIALLRELGVREPEAFAKEIVEIGRLPTPEELDNDFGHDYATAQLRFNTMVIQEPGVMDRPELAQNPIGRLVYGITGFAYGYWRNIIKRNGILMSQLAKDKSRGGINKAALYGSGLFASAAMAYLLGTTISTLREYLLNPKRFRDLDEKGELEKAMATLGFQRTFSFGIADTFTNAWTGLKYQRDLSNIAVGAQLGSTLQDAQKIAAIAQRNSRKTNTAEYSATQGAYSLASPFLAFGLARIPGGPVIEGATGAGMAYITSPVARDNAATFVVGPKNGTTVDGEKVKSGPTALDRTLNDVFGPPKSKKKKEDPSESLYGQTASNM